MSRGEHEITAYSLTIGSQSDNDLVIDKPTVSNRHAQVFWDAESKQWVLEDLGSTNGTYLRDELLSPHSPVPIQVGDSIHLGKFFALVLTEQHLEKAAGVADETGQQQATLEDAPTQAMPALPDVGFSQDGPTAETQSIPNIPAFGQPLGSLSETQTIPVQDPKGFAGAGPVMTQVLTPELFSRLSDRAQSQIPGQTSPPEVPPPPSGVPSISIGYADDNDVRIKNPVVSSHHAKLYQVGQTYILEDQGSTNGTWFLGHRIRRVNIGLDGSFSVGNYTLHAEDLGPYFRQVQTAESTAESPVETLRQPIQLGRSPECDIRVDAPMVSAFHARLTPLTSGGYRLEDLGSTNGTYVNSRENQISTTTVGAEDVIFLGSYRLPLSRITSMLARVGGEQVISIPTDKAVINIGRDDECDIVLQAPQVSRQHAELRRLPDGGFELRDLNSINGTYVNGQRIKSPVRLQPTDLISFASFRLRIDLLAGVVRRDYHGDIMLQAEQVSVRIRDKKSPGGYKTILEDASFTAYPTEFVGLMGPSGAGKTTLMLALNGYSPPTAGRSLLNGYNLYANYNSFRGNIGYVPQDDIVFAELTVHESLYFTARLRLPPDTTDEEIRTKIDDILRKLELEQARDVMIGDEVKKGISGGQRKRVNLAQELITEPSLLFLDEPTSGLASEDAINVMNLLRRLADEGRTIILTIHQPSLEAYRKLDNVIYLFHGRLVYYGPAHPDGIAYFYPESTAGTPEGDLLLSEPGNSLKALAEEQRQAMETTEPWRNLEKVVEDRRQLFLNSTQYKDYVYDRAVAPQDEVRLGAGSKQKTDRRGWLRQGWILTQRLYTIKRKDIVSTTILLLQAPIIGVILWLVFGGRTGSYFSGLSHGPAGLFLLITSAVWFGCSNSAREIVREQAIYKRERMVNLMIPSYILSKFAVLGLVCAIQCAVLLGIVYPSLGYSGNLGLFYLLLFLASLVGVGMGLTLSAVVRSNEAAMALVPLLLIPQVVLGGIIMPIHDLHPVMSVLSATMTTRWGYEGALHIEYGDDDIDALREACGIDVCPDPMGFEQEATGDEEIIEGVLGEIPDRSYFPSGEGSDYDICTILCTNARRGTEVTPLEVAFGLDVGDEDPMRMRYFEEYDVGADGSQTGLLSVFFVLLFMNLLLFALVCAILRFKDVEVG